MTDHAPTITSDDLILRGYLESDFAPFAEFAASERSRYVGGPVGRVDSWRSYLAAIGHWTLRGYGMWIVEHRTSGEVVGRVGIVLNDGWHEPELGWHIYDGFEGKGIAYNASLVARQYSAKHFGLDRVMSYIDPDNHRSVRLATRLGAVFEKNVEVRGSLTQMWRHPSVLERTA
ncbi:MAG: GNAT family N-acetyltransferase [Pseudomonadota bacterium]